MKKLYLAIMLCTTLAGCGVKSDNPLLTDYNTPYNAPPFDRIKNEHFKPAIQAAIAEKRYEIDLIANSPEGPTYTNTIVAKERAGQLLKEVYTIFYNLSQSESTPERQALEEEIEPWMTELENDILMNEKLFARVKQVWDMRENLILDPEQKMLLEKTYRQFVLNGAGLNTTDQNTFRAITKEIALLKIAFRRNVLEATNSYALNLTDESKVAGLPASVRETLAAEAAERDQQGWTITLQTPTYLPAMAYASDRDVRRTLWMKYHSRCFEGGDTDNTETMRRIANLRLQMAKLLGYENYSQLATSEMMAGTPERVEAFLNGLLDKGKAFAQRDFNEVRDLAAGMDPTLKSDLRPWDFSYYSEINKSRKYALDPEEVRPYFSLENVQEGLNILAGKLFGLTFTQNTTLPVYHPDVLVSEVRDQGGMFLGLIYMDLFPRAGKRPGAWMSVFRDQYTDNAGNDIRPIVTLNCNLTKPTPTSPSLITFQEFSTLLHEFGHALHGVMATGRYASLSGTNSDMDFVELPSQLIERWATEKEFLRLFAKHYQTGESIPDRLVDAIVKAGDYQAAYLHVRQLGFGMLDMAWYTATQPVTEPVAELEGKALRPTQFFEPVPGTSVSSSFHHIFSGGYASSYFSYKWSEVMAADVFRRFQKEGIFNRELGDSLRHAILEPGGSRPPMELYKEFMGREPDPGALTATFSTI